MTTQPTKATLLAHFKKDPTLFAYHIGDLDDFFYSYCDWPTLKNTDGTIKEAESIDEALLIYNHPNYTTVMAFGLTDKFGEFLEGSLDQFPDKFYCHFQEPHGAIFRTRFAEEPLGAHLKMHLTNFTKLHDENDSHLVKLNPSDNDMITQFYKIAYPDGYYDPRTLETGHVIGYIKDQQLQAVAGLHVYSKKYNIAVLGSIAVLPDCRGRGLGTIVTSKLTENLLVGNRLVCCLNVKADNYSAISCYKKLGFETIHHYQESAFTKLR